MKFKLIVMRGAESSTDHRLIRSTLRLTVRPPARRLEPRHELSVHAAHNQNIREELRNAIAQSLYRMSTTTTLNCTSNITMECQALSSALLIASQSTLGNMERRHQDWFDDNATDICSLLHNKNAANVIQHLALFMNVFPLYVRQCSTSKGGRRTTGWCGRRLRYRAMSILMIQRAYMKH